MTRAVSAEGTDQEAENKASPSPKDVFSPSFSIKNKQETTTTQKHRAKRRPPSAKGFLCFCHQGKKREKNRRTRERKKGRRGRERGLSTVVKTSKKQAVIY
jgi:hypothetical protein